MRILPRDEEFYALLSQQAEAAYRAASEMWALSKDFSTRDEAARRIEQIEHEADDLTHQIANRADSTFVTPIDKEDIHHLSSVLDDITDYIEAAVGRIGLYRLEEARPDFEPLVSLLVQSTRATADAVARLKSGKNRHAVHEGLVKIHDLENAGDRAFRRALADLFNEPGVDPITVLKWKEIYDRIEVAVDRCEDVANLLESVAVKYA